MHAAAMLAMLAAVALVEPEVQLVSSPLKTYPVEGTTLSRMRQSIRENGPPMHYRKTARAKASSRLDWELRHESVEDGCRVAAFKVVVTQGLLMPQWGNREYARPEVGEKWDAFYADLLRHENTHLANALDAANELARRMRSMGSFPDCASLRAEIARQRQRVMDDYRRNDQEFDDRERRRPDLLR